MLNRRERIFVAGVLILVLIGATARQLRMQQEPEPVDAAEWNVL